MKITKCQCGHKKFTITIYEEENWIDVHCAKCEKGVFYNGG